MIIYTILLFNDFTRTEYICGPNIIPLLIMINLHIISTPRLVLFLVLEKVHLSTIYVGLLPPRMGRYSLLTNTRCMFGSIIDNTCLVFGAQNKS